jgi:hypothetical protein
MEGGYKYTERFRLTSVKMEQLLSMVGPFLRRETNESRDPSEKLLQIVLNWLRTGGQYHSVCDTHGVSTARVGTIVLTSNVT